MAEPHSGTAFAVAVYNPALLKKEDLIGGFVARQPLLDRLLDELRREAPGSTPQHQVIIGQRGFGKTTLLRRLAFAIEDDPALAARWIPVVFPEEQYNVASLSDFWLNCVDALSDALDCAGEQAASKVLDQRIERLSGSANGSGEAWNLLIGEANRLGRRILLLVDNIDIVLDRLKSDSEWEFRRSISHEPRVHIIGASSRALEAFYEHGRAFYDFFQIHELKGFDEEETFRTLCRLSQQTGNTRVEEIARRQPGRIKALRVLTGGNPRTLVLLFKVLAQGPEGDVQRDIEQLLDEYTALYKARFEELPPQAQQVVDAVAIHWDPVTAADLTQLLSPLTVNQVSAQLNRLEDLAVVEKTPWFGEKKNAFQIAERFFNIWYLMRASRRVRRRLLWLVKFLETWFDREELSARARRFLDRDPSAVGRERYAEMALAYSQAVPDRHLRRSLESAGLHAVIDDGIRRLIDFSDLPPDVQDKRQRMQQLRDLREAVCNLKIDWAGIEPAEFWRLLGGSPHFSLAEKARTVEQLASLSPTALSELYSRLRFAEQRILTLYRVQAEDVRRLYEGLAGGEIADVYDSENTIAVAKQYHLHWLPFIAVRSRTNPYLYNEKLSPEELKRAESIVRGMTTEEKFETLAWVTLGSLLRHRLSHYQESEQAYRRAIEQDPLCGSAWDGLGNLFQYDLQRYDDAERAYRRAIGLDPRLPSPHDGLGDLLQYRLERYAEAEQEYHRAIDLHPQLPFPHDGLGDLLQYRLGRHEEAEQEYRRAIELDPNFPYPHHGLAYLLQSELKRYEEAEREYRRAIELDPQFALAWGNLGDLLQDRARYGEAEEAYRRAIELDSKSLRPWFSLGYLLQVQMGRSEEAEQAYRKAIELDPSVTASWNNLGNVLRKLERHVEAEQTYRQCIELDPESAYPWRNLGSLLQLSPGREREAGTALLRAFELDQDRTWDLEMFTEVCHRLADSPGEGPAALELAQKAHQLAPDDPQTQFLLARALTLNGNWPAAAALLEKLAATESTSYSPDFFRTVVKTGNLDGALAILERTGANERWRPLYEALRAARAGTPRFLRTVAPEIRVAATEILRDIDPNLFASGDDLDS